MATKETSARVKAPSAAEMKEYRDFIGGLELKDVAVRRASMHRTAKQIDISRKVDVGVDDKTSFSMVDGSICEIEHAYSLHLCYQGEKTTLVTIECEFEVIYGVAKPMTDAYFGVFKKTSLPLNTWPYWREFVHSAFARMGLPPFVLPVVRQA